MSDATATAASWASSTARSPTMWQPRIVWFSRSATSLQNPVGRPSMIGRGRESKPSVPTATSWASRATASVSPTEAYSGSVKLPTGLTSAGRASAAPTVALIARGLVDDHQVPGDVAGGIDARRCRAELGVDSDVAAWVGLDPGGGKIEVSGVRDPPDRDDRQRRVDLRLLTASEMDESHAGGRWLEPLDGAGMLEDAHSGGLERRAHRCRHLLVLTHQDPGGGLEQRDL